MMRECICCQCEERAGQFKNYVQCESCGLYGNKDDDFGDSETVCGNCVEQLAKDINWEKQ